MKRDELARALSDKEHVTRAAARDTLDAIIHEILTQLREGQAAEMPGVGQLISQNRNVETNSREKPSREKTGEKDGAKPLPKRPTQKA